MSEHRVAIVAGARTPFVKAGKAFASNGPLALAKHAVRGLLDRHAVDPAGIEAIAFGVVVPERGKPNLAREIVLETGLPAGIEAQTVSSYCITGLRTATIIADAIARGRIASGIAGGVEWLSGADPATFQEPTTGLTMGQHMEITRREWGIPRERQDEVALASHRNAVAARERRAGEIVPVEGVEHDTGPRADTSLEKLAKLAPVFDPAGRDSSSLRARRRRPAWSCTSSSAWGSRNTVHSSWNSPRQRRSSGGGGSTARRAIGQSKRSFLM